MRKNEPWLRRLPIIIGVSLALSIVAVIYYIQSQFDKPVQTKKPVQQITVIRPPPPPPPPPPEEKIPEPEPQPIEEPQPDSEPEPSPDDTDADAPAGDELGLDAEGAAGSDGFGLLGKKGGRGLLGGGGGNAILWYGNQVKQSLEEELQTLLADSGARKERYSVLLNIWINPDGRIGRAELIGSSGKKDVDQSIQAALPKLRIAIGKAPPQNMPQPLKIKLISRI